VNLPSLRLAIADYDRAAALADGGVPVKGVDLSVDNLAPSEIFYRMLAHDEFDLSEMSLSSYLIAREQGRAWTAIPVFPHRTAFHTNVYVREVAGIATPADLAGKRFGLTEYQVTAAVWTRGVLQHDFGVDPTQVEWYVERTPELSHGGETGFTPPAGVQIRNLPEGETLHTMMQRGELDAVLPSPYPGMTSRLNRTDETDLRTAPGIRRLFTDPWKEAARIFIDHGFLHANHTIVVQDRHLEADPDLARRLFDAFVESKEIAYHRLRTLGRSSLVLGAVRLEEQQAVFGDDPFPYGLAANRRALETLATFSHEQGLTKAPADVDSLFTADTLDT
jgi:4,5-dihydroxyphthalate decarboxylase